MKSKGILSSSMIDGIVNIKRVFQLSPSAVKRLVAGNICSSISYFLNTYVLARVFAKLVSETPLASDEAAFFAVSVIAALICMLGLIAISTYLIRNAVIALDIALKRFFIEKSLNGALLSREDKPADDHSDEERVSVLLNDIPLISESIEAVLNVIIEVIILGFGGLIVVLLVSPLVGLAVLVLEAANLLYSLFFAGRLYHATQSIQQQAAKLLRTIKHMLEGTILFRLFFPRNKSIEQYDQAAEQRAKAGAFRAIVSGTLGGMNNAMSKIAPLVLYLTAAVCLFSGRLSQALFLQVVQWGMTAAGAFMFSRQLVEIQKSMVGANRIWRTLDAIEPEAEREMTSAAETELSIEFQDVGFQYGEKSIFQNVSFSVSSGDFVVITGRSGGGKTTLLRLMLGLSFPTNGAVFINGIETTKWNLPALRQLITVVPQDNNLFSGTVRENISVGLPLSDEEIKAAAVLAEADEFINQLPEGYDTVISEKGDTLSGGQKQRISIARAIARKTPVILLDEASSAIDEAMERELLLTLRKLRKNHTLIFVSHRPQTIAAGDRIVQLN